MPFAVYLLCVHHYVFLVLMERSIVKYGYASSRSASFFKAKQNYGINPPEPAVVVYFLGSESAIKVAMSGDVSHNERYRVIIRRHTSHGVFLCTQNTSYSATEGQERCSFSKLFGAMHEPNVF